MHKYKAAVVSALAAIAVLAPATSAQNFSEAALCQINAQANRTAATAELQAVADKSRNATVRVDTPTGLGTGFFVSADGLLLTAYHVVRDDNQWNAILADRTTLKLSLVGFDENRDIALLKASGQTKPIDFVQMETTAPKLGESIYAIGNSCNSFVRARFGKVTDLARDISRAFPGGLLVTDMPLAPGDSGGPVFNAAGRVIGISDAIGYDEKNPNADRPASFIAPLWDQAKLITDMKAGYQHEVPFIGIGLDDYPQEAVAQYGGAVGVIVTGITPGSGAEKAGLRTNANLARARTTADFKTALAATDIITAADGQAVTSSEDLIAYLRTRNVGDTVELTVQRGTGSVKLKVTLGSRRALQQTR